MNIMDVDAVIAEATKTQVAPPAQAPQGAIQTDPAANQPAKPDDVEPQDLANKPDSELTPEQLAKREANRQSHLNSKLAKLRRENRALKAQQGQNPADPAQAQPAPAAKTPVKAAPVKPKEEDFQTWGEFQDAKDKYFEDLSDWKVEQALAARDSAVAKNTPPQVDPKVVGRIQEVANQEAEFAKENPEYSTLYEQNAEFMNNLPLHIAEALMLADNASLALFALMKEGKLDDLEDMSPAQVIMEIGKAQIRGNSYLNKQPENKATNAPAPLTPAKGNANTGKSLNEKSVEELMEQFGRRN